MFSGNLLYKPFIFEKGYSNIAEFLIEKSIEFNIDLNIQDESGRTGFHYACMKNHLKLAEMLIQKSVKFKIDLNVQDEDGNTPYHLASIMKNSNLKLMMMKNERSFKLFYRKKNSFIFLFIVKSEIIVRCRARRNNFLTS